MSYYAEICSICCYFGVKQLTPSSIEPPGSLMNADLNRDAVTESSDYTAPNTEPSDRVNSLEVPSVSPLFTTCVIRAR